MRLRYVVPTMLLLAMVAASARAQDGPTIPPPWAERPATAPPLKWIGVPPSATGVDCQREEGSHTPASEKALEAALHWIAEHQMTDGGWCYDLGKVAGCQGRCSGSGKLVDARIAPTCLALNALLGVGNTSKEGKYKEAFKSGQQFLLARGKATSQGWAYQDQEGDAVDQALATMVLCDAYALTHDRELNEPAQKALDQLVAMQDAASGGWAADATAQPSTTATAWCVIAMKKGHMAYLRLPPEAVKRAYGFFDRVQSDGGAYYGEFKPGREPRATAAALYCRMCLGWKRDNPALVRGIEYLGQLGPSKSDLIFNYFATEAIHGWQGDAWKAWNPKMRDSLIATQASEGHETGSWAPGDGADARRGGRLWQTALSTAMLEVYYNLLGSPSPGVVDQEFPD